MSEQGNNERRQDGAVVTKPVANSNPKPKVSKLPLFLAFIALVATVYLAYLWFYGPFGVQKQQQYNRYLASAITSLSNGNKQLGQQITSLQQQQESLVMQINGIRPDHTALVISQLNSLIGGANQSLIIYHDTAGAIKLLDYALGVLTMTGTNPVFDQLKINLSTDLDHLKALRSLDNVVIGSKLDNLYQLSDRLSVVIVAKPYREKPVSDGTWGRFITNFKNTILGVVKVETANSDAANLLPQSEELLRQHLQLDILTAKQAFLSRNPTLWQQSIKDAQSVATKYFVNDQFKIEVIQILAELQAIDLAATDVNLDATMQALMKVNSR